MKRQGRPPLAEKVVEIHIHLRLREGEDDDLLGFFERLPARRRAGALKVALRMGGMQAAQKQDVDNDEDILAAMDELLF